MHAGISAPCFAVRSDVSGIAGRKTFVALLVVAAALAGCSSRMSPAPVTDLTQGPPATDNAINMAGKTYTVRAGDTLYKISQSTGVDVSTLVRLNSISDPSQLRIGQVLRLGGSANVATGPSPTPAPTQAPGTETPPAPPASTPAPVTPVTPSVPASAPRASDAALIQWSWPSGGKIIQGFNANTKGIDIEGAEGDPVQAAADGKVMYAGNGVRGLGNLILLGHSDGFITAYAHNQTLLVKTGEQVKKGAKIATIGQTDTTSPRLHFEIRRRGTPVNPLSYLPSR
ncbi:peptidoglycan DD-metalloendopeptidase family protein [Paracandidimonas soli]|uniref:Lipoprotein NlpD n=1 Tax=Paracandidimonas soli TaxID=1917182 RepID=A0A4R3V8U8_9BURK|nr:peptidoglycan DD-metalloendopeptidase family protein [Paracandidimonas soli]TCV01576.1 lipoprotein NlpD [Paracandidimonas soli]